MSEREEILTEGKNSILDLSNNIDEVEFPIRFVKKNTVLGKALCDGETKTVKLRKGHNKIELKEKAFLEAVVFSFTSENVELNVEIKTLDGKWRKLKSSPPTHLQREYLANKFISEVRVSTPKKFFSVQIDSINLRGFDIKDLSKIENQYMEVIRRIDEFEVKSKQYINDINNDISRLDALKKSSDGLEEKIYAKLSRL